jgi:hypothetical protein
MVAGNPGNAAVERPALPKKAKKKKKKKKDTASSLKAVSGYFPFEF